MALSTSAAYLSSATQVRPADTTAYAAGDVVSNSTSAPVVLTFSDVGPTKGSIIIQSASIRLDQATLPSGMAGLRLHLYSSAPTAINDNAAYNLPSGDRDKYVCYVDFSTPIDIGDTLISQVTYVGQQARLYDGNLYGILQTVAGYTPTSASSRTLKLYTIEAGR